MKQALTHAGCITFRSESGRMLYLVVSSSSGKHWVLPQGHIEEGELPQEAALRELGEEAGVRGEVVAALSTYSFTKKMEEVRIQYFLMRATGLTETNEGRILRWEEEQAARELLSFEAAQAALNEGAEIVRRLE